MSTIIHPYLFFTGRCDEAIAFYKQALGAELRMLMRYNQSPQPAPPGMLPAGFEDKVMHAEITIQGAVVMLSDGNTDKGKFDGFQLSLSYTAEADAKKAFNALAEGGSITMPLGKTFWSPCFGMLTDKFGLDWMISLPGEPPK
jgi:PhnB protein